MTRHTNDNDDDEQKRDPVPESVTDLLLHYYWTWKENNSEIHVKNC